MPEPATVHFDAALTNVSLAYRNAAFVAPEIAPEVPVRRQSNRYFVYDPQREAARSTDDYRAPGTEATEVDFALSSDAYFCDDHALGAFIPDEERLNADSPLQPEVDRVEFLTEKILLNQEVNLAALLRDDTAVPSTPLAPGARWDEPDVDPLAAVDTARDAIVSATQMPPNTLVLPYAVYHAVRRNPLVGQRVSYSRLGVFTPVELAQLFDVERVLVARAVRNTSNPGQAPALENIWGTDAILMYVPPRAGLKTIAPVLRFVWSHATGASRGASVQSWREERRKATAIRVQKYYDQKLVAPAAAHLIQTAIS